MALEVEEHVAVVGFGQLLEAAAPHRIVGRLDHPERRRLAVRSARRASTCSVACVDQPLEPFGRGSRRPPRRTSASAARVATPSSSSASRSVRGCRRRRRASPRSRHCWSHSSRNSQKSQCSHGSGTVSRVGRVGGDDVGELGAEAVPVGRNSRDRQRLDAAGAEPQVHVRRDGCPVAASMASA